MTAGVCASATIAQATWSIVVVDRDTGEVAVAGATCIPDIFLKGRIGVIVVGKGGGAGQAVSSPILNFEMGEGLEAGWSPEEILASFREVRDEIRRRLVAHFGWSATTP